MNDDISDAVKYGDFEVFSGDNYEALLPELKLEGFDSDFDNFLSEMVVSDFDITLTQQAFADLKTSDDPGLPAPETPTSTRFAKLSDDEIKGFQELTQSKATKQSTKWGLKILTDWHIETFGVPLDLAEICEEDLAKKLSRFYCEAKPQNPKKEHTSEYHKNTMKAIRAAINRHLSDIGRNIDIVNDKAFKTANKSLTGLMKHRMVTGTSRPTTHKEIIHKSDLQKISAYLESAYSSPVNLRLAMWYIIAIHFVSRGLEFHHQLRVDSFDFKVDEEGSIYACLKHETKQKNYQGGIHKLEALNDKRMYETGNETCPVKMLKFFLSKTDPNASHLFNKCVKDAISYPKDCNIWYTADPMKKRSYVNFLPDICKAAGCKRYTAHCLRATAIQAMNDAGFEARHIMYFSGHRNEASIRSYNRELSSTPKKSASATLSTITTASVKINDPSEDSCVISGQQSQNLQIVPYNSENSNLPVKNELNCSTMSDSSIKSGVLNNSRFENCSITIKYNLD